MTVFYRGCFAKLWRHADHGPRNSGGGFEAVGGDSGPALAQSGGEIDDEIRSRPKIIYFSSLPCRWGCFCVNYHKIMVTSELNRTFVPQPKVR